MKTYKARLSVSVNRKGVLDIDTVKGCTEGMKAHPNGGCYGLCYAAKMARLYGYDFAKSVSRPVHDSDRDKIVRAVVRNPESFFRIGTMGDPSHDWPLTVEVCEWLGPFKVPVVVTKHWRIMPDELLSRFAQCGAIVNTSISALDTEAERTYRLSQYDRLHKSRVKSVLRIVSVNFEQTGLFNELTDRQGELAAIQRGLFENRRVIDNPLRIPETDLRVLRNQILTERRKDIASDSTMSVSYKSVYTGICKDCPDKCGVNMFQGERK